MTGARAPRLPPLPTDQWDDDVRAALRTGLGGLPGEPVPNVLGTLVRHPRLAGPFLAYNTMLLRGAELAPRLRELMILRVGWRTGATYEWLQHVRMAQRLGVTPEEIEAIGGDPAAGPWSPLESVLLVATDQLIDHYRVNDATWARLAEHLDERQLVEVVFVVGTYTCLAMAFNSFDLQPDADLGSVTAPMPPPKE
jgi:4-carboxymuconolactone decarboxylase